MERNENEGFDLKNSKETKAAIWIARATGSKLDEIIISRQHWEPTAAGPLTAQAELDKDESEILVSDLMAVVDGKAKIRPEYREAAKLMLVDCLDTRYAELLPAYMLSWPEEAFGLTA